MSDGTARQGARGMLRGAVAFASTAEPRRPVPRRAMKADALLAGVALAVALIVTRATYHGLGGGAIAAALVESVPLAVRRRFPLAAFLVLLVGVVAAKYYATDLTFLTLLIAGYSAAVHSRYRGLALLCLLLAGALVAYVFWKGQDAGPYGAPVRVLRKTGPVTVVPGPLGGFFVPQGARWRLDGMVALLALVGISIVSGAAHVGERIRRMQSQHEQATRLALEAERARIASELHDVVTHNVSIMIVQAGAARQVLDGAPSDAKAALLAVESSGRAAMSELRHLLGLLSPAHPRAGAAAEAPTPGRQPTAHELSPQPGLGQLPALISRMRDAGLPVDLRVGDLPAELPPGLDLAAFRVVQEALTNVLKHAGKPATTVSVQCRDGSLQLEVADRGRPMPAVGPVAVPGSGHGLIGLRERVGVYGGELEAGPQPGGGWRVRARIPAPARDAIPDPAVGR